MKSTELKCTRIGNSRGIRLPAATLLRYRIGEAVIMEETSEGIMRPIGPSVETLSWEATAREMAVARGDWNDWDAADADGLDAIPWDSAQTPRVTEGKALTHSTRRSVRKK